MRVFKGIKKVASYAAVGGFGAVVMAGLAGCGSNDNGGESSALNEAAQKTGAFVIIEGNARRTKGHQRHRARAKQRGDG